MNNISKKLLRQQLIAARQSLTLEIWQTRSQAICKHLLGWHRFQQAGIVLSFMSFRQEPDLSSLWQHYPDQSQPKIWGLPRCEGVNLIWHQVPTLDDQFFEISKYGIREPLSILPEIDMEQLKLVLVPSVACDRQGYRLGYGSGFYDRFLGAHQEIFTVGITFADSLFDQLPIEDWDIPLHAVCTEVGLKLITS